VLTISIAEARKLLDKIKKKGGSGLKPVKENLVDLVWGNERPPPPDQQVTVHDVKYSGKKFQEKIQDLRKELEKKKSAGFIACK
jgi:Xaa-Pro aminopeptidase